jgi:hypothetical protein
MNENDLQEESQFEKLQKNKFAGSESLGGTKQENPYKSSTPQERFSKQLDRDLSRGSLSQSTIRKLITDNTAAWANSIYSQKLAQNAATSASFNQNSSTANIAPAQITQNTSFKSPEEGNSAGADTDTTGEIVTLRVCIGGITKTVDVYAREQPY